MPPGYRPAEVPLERLDVRALTIPTDRPESDGTLQWDSTTMVLVEVAAGGRSGLGYTYAAAAAGKLIRDLLREHVVGRDALGIPALFAAMHAAVRNNGVSGLGAMAVAAVDVALWDLKARLLELPLADLLGQARPSVRIYGSGGFTSYSNAELQEQLAGWVAQGIGRVKMKVGRDPAADPGRVRAAREAIGPAAELFVDANGAYGRKQALALGRQFAEAGVSWFEQPVYHQDFAGLRLLRDRLPAGMDVASGEYGFEVEYFRRLLEAGAVDVLMADATRCGITGFLQAAALCEAFRIPLSSHCAPALHLHLGCAAAPVRHLEYFHDHVRIERMLFDGVPEPRDGRLRPDPGRPGLGLTLKQGSVDGPAIQETTLS